MGGAPSAGEKFNLSATEEEGKWRREEIQIGGGGRGGTLNASSSGGAAKDGGRDRGVRGGKEGDVEEICNWGRIVKRGGVRERGGKGMEEEAHSFHFRPPMSLGRCAAHREKKDHLRDGGREREGGREEPNRLAAVRRPPNPPLPSPL